MARIIQEKIKVPLAEIMLKKSNKLDNIKVDFCNDKNKFKFSFTNSQRKLVTVFAED